MCRGGNGTKAACELDAASSWVGALVLFAESVDSTNAVHEALCMLGSRGLLLEPCLVCWHQCCLGYVAVVYAGLR